MQEVGLEKVVQHPVEVVAEVLEPLTYKLEEMQQLAQEVVAEELERLPEMELMVLL